MGDGITNSAFQMSLPPLGGGGPGMGGMGQGNTMDMEWRNVRGINGLGMMRPNVSDVSIGS